MVQIEYSVANVKLFNKIRLIYSSQKAEGVISQVFRVKMVKLNPILSSLKDIRHQNKHMHKLSETKFKFQNLKLTQGNSAECIYHYVQRPSQKLIL